MFAAWTPASNSRKTVILKAIKADQCKIAEDKYLYILYPHAPCKMITHDDCKLSAFAIHCFINKNKLNKR